MKLFKPGDLVKLSAKWRAAGVILTDELGPYGSCCSKRLGANLVGVVLAQAESMSLRDEKQQEVLVLIEDQVGWNYTYFFERVQ